MVRKSKSSSQRGPRKGDTTLKESKDSKPRTPKQGVNNQKQTEPKPTVQPKKNKKQKQRSLPSSLQGQLAKLSLGPPGDQTLAEILNRSNGGGSSGSQKEVFLTVTDFFDLGINDGTPEAPSVLPYGQWSYKPEQDLFMSNYPNYKSYTKLLEAWLYVLPRFNLDTADGSVLVLTTVPVTATGGGKLAANPRSTMITPSSNPKWKCIGHYKTKKLFADAEMFPSGTTTGNGQIVFSVALLDPDSMSPISAVSPVQLKVVIRVACPLPVLSTFFYGGTRSDQSNTLSDSVAQSNIGGRLCQMEITGMGDVA